MIVKWQDVMADGETMIGPECCGTSSFCLGGCGIQPQCCCKLHPTSLESGTRLINFIFLRGGMALSSGSRPEFMKLNHLMKCGSDYVAQADFEPLHSSDSLVPSSEVLGLQVCVTESSLVEITLNDN